jgi:hypothetical protein
MVGELERIGGYINVLYWTLFLRTTWYTFERCSLLNFLVLSRCSCFQLKESWSGYSLSAGAIMVLLSSILFKNKYGVLIDRRPCIYTRRRRCLWLWFFEGRVLKLGKTRRSTSAEPLHTTYFRVCVAARGWFCYIHRSIKRRQQRQYVYGIIEKRVKYFYYECTVFFWIHSP